MIDALRVAALITVGLAATSCTSTAGHSGDAAASPGTSTLLPAGQRGRIDRVVDGDTVIVDGRRVRLIGIDAPESVKPDSPVECYGPEASHELSRLLPRRTPVLLEYDLERTDQYGRALAYVWRTRPVELVNLDLVRDGYATVDTFPPNVAHQPELEAAQRQARTKRLGLWAACR